MDFWTFLSKIKERNSGRGSSGALLSENFFFSFQRQAIVLVKVQLESSN